MSAQTMRLLNTTSEQNLSTRNKTYFAYVCLVGNIKPGENSTADYGANSSKRAYLLADDETEGVDLNEDDSAIAVERSKALHELIERRCREDSDDDNKDRVKLNPSQTDESSDTENNNYNNPNILKLTKMKWLTESHNGSPDASLTSLSPVESNTSLESDDINKTNNSDRFLDTILRLDKEHNMFGLSNITIVGARPSKKIRKDEDKAVFHQTAIVQICCYKQCCRHKSNTDLPSSLKCGGCRLCCFDPVCPTCPPPGPPCGSCKSYCPAPEIPFPCPSKCQMSNGFGLQIKVVKKPKYEPTYVELTPRSSCVLQKPFAARSCHHFPRCMPPSSCFPYLMPCFWPARPSAPCSEPAHCFHNPPCPAARKPKTCIHPDEKCPTDRYCEDSSKKTKCTNLSCLGGEAQNKCEACLKGKLTAEPFPKASSSRTTQPLQLIHSDVCGPLPVASWGGARYLVTFTDDFTRKSFGYLMKNKSQMENTVQEVEMSPAPLSHLLTSLASSASSRLASLQLEE